MTTTGYQAAVESNAVQLSYAKEVQWGVRPAVAFQALRAQSEGFQGQKQRTRPNEMRSDAQASPGVTQSISAPGTLNFAFHYGTYDDILQSLIMGTWSSAVTIDGAAGDISFVASGNKVTSTTSGKFNDILVGMQIRVMGCTVNPADMFLRVITKTNNQDITVVGETLQDETPTGAAVKIRNGGMLRNNAEFHSIHVQKMLAADKFLLYPGAYLTGGTLNGQQGQFMQGSFNFAAKSEEKSTSNASTGAVLAAPTGRVIDTVAGMQRLLLNGDPIDAVVQAVNWTVNKEGAQGIYGIGSPNAQGMVPGTFTLTGTVTIGFRDFGVYDAYVAETQNTLSYATLDDTGAGYMFTIPATVFGTSRITASGPNQPVMAEFNIEADPHAATGTTLQIDRFAAPA